jgi:hypothetical protein
MAKGEENSQMTKLKNGFLPIAIAIFFVSAPVHAQQTVGLFINGESSYDGYTLFTPISSTNTYLIDNEGKQVQSWVSDFRPGQSVYLLETGNLLRTAQYAPGGVSRFIAGGNGGRVEEYTWDGTLVWDYIYSDDQHRQHHDIERLPNGNVLLVAWEYKSYAEAIAAGRSPSLLTDGELWPDHIVEIEPVGPTGGNIVWEWHVWDHLVQEHDPTKDNYGIVGAHPELIDINYTVAAGPNAGRADWNHTNAIDYNETFDQIILSVHGFNEIWIIDHSTTTEEAAGHTGGNSGKGGDLLYRWGNPEAYDRGGAADEKLFRQHDSQWIETGYPSAGNVLIFNNGLGRPGGDYSSVDEIVPPVDELGNYYLEPNAAYGPSDLLWSYAADPPSDFYAQNISGAYRLPNGNTLICSGPQGTFFEVTPAKETVWRYVNPITGTGPITQGQPAMGNAVFRAYRYGPDYSAFDGKDLTPSDPLEQFTRPIPVPDGEGTSEPMTCSRITAEGDWIQVGWDTVTCPAYDYNLIFGDLAGLSTYTLQGSECAIGVVDDHDWYDVPAGDLFFLIVGVDSTGVYESSWGTDGAGEERNGTSSSWMCGVTTRDSSESCP